LPVVILLVVATLAAYWGVWHNGFVNFDDHTYVTGNRHISEGLSWKGLQWAFTEIYTCNWHPLTWISHMLDVQMFGLWAGGHHLVSLGLHILNSLMLFGFLRYTTRRLWASAFVAALFALHPLHVESVAWAAERKDVLSTFFWLATMWMYAFYAKRPGWGRYLGVAALLSLGLMSKPMLVTLPLVLLLLDYWPLERFGGDGRRKASAMKLIVEKVPLMAMAVASAIVTLQAQKGAIATLDMVNLPTRVTNSIISYWRYIWMMVWPVDLAVLYPYSHHPHYAAVAVVLLMLAAATAAAMYWGRKFRYLAIGWLWYLLTLVPVIGLVQVGEQSHADRYTYVPLIGLFLIIVWMAAETAGRYPVMRKVIVVTGILILIAASLVTRRQVGYWRDSIVLFERTIAVTKDNYVAGTNLGNALIDDGQYDKAMVILQEAIKVRPLRPETMAAIGTVLNRKGKVEESLEYYKKAVAIQPDLKEGQVNLGATFLALGRYTEAEACFSKAISLDKYWADPWAQRGMTLGLMGQVDDGIVSCNRALELDPGLGMAHFSIAALYAMKRDFASAVEEYRKCLAISREYSVLKNLGNCLLAAGKKEEAESMLREAMEQRPKAADIHYYLATALDALGRKDEAIEEVRKALELEPDNKPAKEYLKILTEKSK
jgi:tetratricopeptide (TPR) repeat protein